MMANKWDYKIPGIKAVIKSDVSASEACVKLIAKFREWRKSESLKTCDGLDELNDLMEDMEFLKNRNPSRDDLDEILEKVYDWADAYYVWLD